MTGPRLVWHGDQFELRVRRAGLRTAVTLRRDAEPVAEAAGLGRVLLTVPGGPDTEPLRVLVLAPLPGTVARAVLLVPRPEAEDGAAEEDDAEEGADEDMPEAARTALLLSRAERHPFDPVPGTLAARLRAVEEGHPRLWASRHVVLAVGKVVAGLLGLAALLQLLVQPLIRWLVGLIRGLDLPSIPWPDVDLPSIPWPDVDLPDFSLPGWLRAVLDTAKYWGPVLVAVGLAVREARRRRGPAGRGTGTDPDDGAGQDGPDAHRRP